MWCRCDSKTGYLFQFDLYLGKKTGYVEHGLGEGVVLYLTNSIQQLGCEVYIDNFFNSPQLQFTLLQQGIYSCGTVRPNKKKLPKSDKVLSKEEMSKGDMICLASKRIYYTKWMDNKPVHLLSNFIAAHPVNKVERNMKGSSSKVTTKTPHVVKKYNEFMGGVDLMDQKKVMYQFDHRSKHKYYLRVVHDIIDIAVNNAAVVYSKLCDRSNQCDLKTYRRVVARALIANYTSRKRATPSSSILKATKRAHQQQEIRNSSNTQCKKYHKEKDASSVPCKKEKTKPITHVCNAIFICVM